MPRYAMKLVPLTALAAVLGACASSDPSATASILTPVAASSAHAAPTSGQKSGGYQLNEQELQFECKQLMGRMQIRILEIRDYNERNTTSQAARALQSGASTVLGGTKAGTDPHGRYAQDRAMLEAYNRQLAAKGCRSYDLEAELQPKDFRVSPSATIKPAAGQGASKSGKAK